MANAIFFLATLAQPSFALESLYRIDQATVPIPSLFDWRAEKASVWREPGREAKFSNTRLGSRFDGQGARWSPAWQFSHHDARYGVEIDDASGEFATQSTTLGIGLSTPNGWGVLLGPDHYRLHGRARGGASVSFGYTDQTRTNTLSLTSPLAGTSTQEIHVDASFWTVESRSDRVRLAMRVFDAGGASVSAQVGPWVFQATDQSRVIPRVSLDYEDTRVRLTYAEGRAQAVELGYRLPQGISPVTQMSAEVAKYSTFGVVRTTVDDNGVRASARNVLTARSLKLSGARGFWRAHTQLSWLESNFDGEVGSDGSTPFIDAYENIQPLQFSDILLVGLRFGAIIESRSFNAHLWAQQWWPLVTWGSGDEIDLPNDTEGASEPNSSPIPNGARRQSHGGFLVGLNVQFPY